MKSRLEIDRRTGSGFALVTTLVMMMLITIIAVGTISLSAVSLRSSTRGDAMAEAKANARLALGLAIAQLQKHTGPDRRVTAPAAILDPGDAVANERWCGVWRTDGGTTPGDRDADFSGWLVTDDHDTPEVGDALREIPGESVAMRKASGAKEVRVPLLTLPGDGRLGWWTEDESLKARADLPDVPATTPGDRTVARHSAARNSPERLPGVEGFDPAAESITTIVTPAQLGLAANKWPEPHDRDFTTYSRSLLTDARNGGIKHDLNTLFELPADKITGFGKWEGSSSTGSQEAYLYGQAGMALGARWNHLHTYYNLYKDTHFSGDEPRISPHSPLIDWHKADSGTDYGDAGGGFRFPRVAKVVYLFSYSARSENNPQQPYTLQMMADIYVTLWNPFDARIVFPANTTFFAKFHKRLPLKFDWRINGSPIGSPTLEDMISAGYFTQSPFYNHAAGSQFSMGPGETLTFSIRRGTKEYHPGIEFEGGISGDQIGPNKAKVRGRASDRISVGLSPTEVAQTGTGNNFSQYLDFWIYDTSREVPYYEHRGEILATSDTKFISWMPGLDPASIPTRSFSQIIGKKQPFAAFIMELKTAEDSTNPISAFLSSGIMRLSSKMRGDHTSFVNERFDYRLEPVTSFDSDVLQITHAGHPAGANHGYTGSGTGPGNGQTHVLAASIPTVPLTSLAQLRHAGTGDSASTIRATVWNHNVNVASPPYADQAIANSYAHPLLPADKSVSGDLLDHRYLGNEALWDHYFFSSLAPRNAGRFQSSESMAQAWRSFIAGEKALLNPRFTPWLDDRDADEIHGEIFESSGATEPRIDAYRRIAAHLMLEGGFNVNSTSVDAWHALLASTHGRSITRLKPGSGTNGDEAESAGALFSRTDVVLGGAADAGSDDLQSHYTGYRDLDDEQLRELAVKIVEQVRLRGPFLSMAEFVNRRLDRDPKLGLSGALQTAIDDAGLNDEVRDAGLPGSPSPGGAAMAFPEASALGTAAGTPGWLMQGDLLDPLGPNLVVRGDTFRIRGYGESRTSTGEVGARAWCEAVVQRLPGYLDGSESPDAYPPRQPLNETWGRRYRVVHFRWLTGAES
ncbi:pilus assembly PilX N-terminal domain-containing protein [Luteolibacter flavescens]|uniref:Pilus assembly PilX N-terminal domain-containing protein n=1 Tax=Luteolibacter flavescens TaxID=1859460 RepID=A0ABT3FSW7_9BACT|nr:pilus assembly PilX N-terminal domain-containing protein [Luteolibacter flavescens]MCW1886678.1 pilus assembly PilX N-terminal domain-containing protein [Luteolibacter flavescens]